MDRLQRKKIKQDEFVASTWRVFEYLEEHPKPFLYGACAFIGVVLLGWAAAALIRGSSTDRADKLSRGQAALLARVDATAAANPDDPYRPVFTNDRERAKAAAARLGDADGAVAKYMQGIALVESGDAAAAIAVLEKAVKELGSDPTLAGPARAALASAYDAGGKPDQAAALWKELSGADSGYPRDLALVALGSSLERAGRKDEAKSAFREATEIYPTSPALANAKAGLSRLGG